MDIVRTFHETVDLEMDLRLEAAAASELRERFEDEPTYRVPEIDWQRTQRRVLTAERIHGVSIDDREALLDAGHDLEDIAGRTLIVFLKQVFRHGFFHADMHAGNLFVDEDGTIVAVDFGIMGRLDRETRRFVAELLLAFLVGDYRRAAEVHFEAGYVPRTKSVEAFAQACRSIGEPILGKPVNEILGGSPVGATVPDNRDLRHADAAPAPVAAEDHDDGRRRLPPAGAGGQSLGDIETLRR